MGSEHMRQEVAWQFSFSDINGASIEPQSMGDAGRGATLLIALTNAGNRLVDGGNGGGSWVSVKPVHVAVLQISLSLTLTLQSAEERNSEEVRGLALSLLKEMREVGSKRHLSCRMLSVAVKKVSSVTTQAWYEGVLEARPVKETVDATQAVGNAVRDQRDRLHLSLDDAARLSGVARRTILRLEQGNQGIAIGNATRIAEALGLEVLVKRRA